MGIICPIGIICPGMASVATVCAVGLLPPVKKLLINPPNFRGDSLCGAIGTGATPSPPAMGCPPGIPPIMPGPKAALEGNSRRASKASRSVQLRSLLNRMLCISWSDVITPA